MAGLVRGLDQLLADLATRARPGPGSKNRPLTKFASVADTVTLSTDGVTTSVVTPPFLWASAAPGSTANELLWSLGEWS